MYFDNARCEHMDLVYMGLKLALYENYNAMLANVYLFLFIYTIRP